MQYNGKQKGSTHCRNNSKMQIKIRGKRQIDTLTTQIHNRSLFQLEAETPIKSGCFKLA